MQYRKCPHVAPPRIDAPALRDKGNAKYRHSLLQSARSEFYDTNHIIMQDIEIMECEDFMNKNEGKQNIAHVKIGMIVH